MERIQKLLSRAGVSSRREAEELIKAGKVIVEGKVATLGDKASERDRIEVEGRRVRFDRPRYLMLHKPVGCVTALRDRHERTVMEFVRIRERVFPVGRLDKHTSGLLLLTNDGDFAERIAHPLHELAKTYLVQLEKLVPKRLLAAISEGVVVEGKTVAARVRKLAPDILEMTIQEGRNRIVRRVMEQLDQKVRRLQRIRIGDLELDVRSGKWRDLTPEERGRLVSQRIKRMEKRRR